MGKKSNYFRHTFNAHKDHKIMELIERGGIKCVGVYFVILELYGAALIDDDEAQSKQKISVRLIANATGLRSDSCRTCVELVADCELIEAVHFMSHIAYFEVDIPNFSKYYGKYSKTEPIESPKKRKEKERKEKESKVNIKKEKPTYVLDPISIFNLWNHTCGEHLPMTKKLTASRKTNINATVKNIPGLDSIEGWKVYFLKILESDFLKGSTGWCATFDWAIKSSNALKVSENKYTNSGKTSQEQKQNKMLNMENPYA